MVDQVKEISLGKGFGAVTLKVNGVCIEVHGDGSVDVYGNASVATHPSGSAANDAGSADERAPPQIGDHMPDGTIYAGLSPDTGEAMYAAPRDAPLTLKWKAAMEYASAFDAHGHQDWRLPSKTELNVLFNNLTAIGGFNVSRSYPAGWYWSGTTTAYRFRPPSAWLQCFADGRCVWDHRDRQSSLRLVRG